MPKKQAAPKVHAFTLYAVARVTDTLEKLAEKEPETAELVEAVLRRAFAPARPTARQKRHLSPYSQAVNGPWRE
jgi:hypothetical protein